LVGLVGVPVAYGAPCCDGVVNAVNWLSSAPSVFVAVWVAVGWLACAMPPAVGESAWVDGYGWCVVHSKRCFLADRVILSVKRNAVEHLYVTQRNVLTGAYHGPDMTEVDRAEGMAVLHSTGR
jgi:hypothetical protein